ncbi:PKD domain-containing protein [Candidatus Bipolaricaulota bacterium]
MLVLPRRIFNQVLRIVMAIALAGMVLQGCVAIQRVPTAAIVMRPQVCYPKIPVEFDGRSSSAGRGDIVEYRWRFSDGSSSIGSVVEHQFQWSGTHSVQLQITTDDGGVASTSRELVVLDALVVPGSYSRIQDAIDAATSGDTIVVLPGTYKENIRVQGKTIYLKSSDPSNPDVVRSTILSGVENGRPTVNFGGGSFATIDGFTILPGASGQSAQCGACGGSIYVREASPYIRNNRIVNASDSGIAVYESSAHIEGNLFLDCTSGLPGGAISVDSYRRAPTIVGNTFEGNSASSGGAIFITASAASDGTAASAAETFVADNEFRGNESTQSHGGAIFVEYYGHLSLPQPDSNTYVGNSPNDIFYVVPH